MEAYMSLKHYKMNSERGVKGKKERTYIAKCGTTGLAHNALASSMSLITCPECILTLMSELETKICTLEDRYEELYPERPVGEKIQ
jgi:hypothetical protein